MLYLLLALNFNLFAKTKLLNTKTQTSFIVLHKETTKWDFTDLQSNRDPFTYTQSSKNYTYYVRFAKELSQSDLPSYADYGAIKNHKGTNAVRCNSYTQKCDILSTIYEYDWNTILDSAPERGVLYIADGKPFMNSDGEYEEWEIHYEFRCNESSESLTPNMFVDTPFKNMPRLYLLFNNKRSCGQVWSAEPTATPSPFNPDCTVYYRQDGDKNRAIYFNLSEWNGGALGIPIDVITTSGNKTLFWEPCERMVNCPWGGNCHGASMSSAWLCDENLDCENFTVIPGGENTSYVDTDLIDGTDINHGFRIKYENSTNGKLYVDITCKGDYPNDHVLFDPTGVYDKTNKVLTISGSTYDACPKDVPEPVPPVDKCRFNLTQEGPEKNEYFIDMDLAVLGTKSKQVEVRGDGGGTQKKLYVAPCDSIPCPDGFDCDGDEDATVLLCELSSETEAPPVCIAYGILDHGISAALKGDYIINGATTYYSGDRGRTAEIDWKCNKSMLSHNYILPDVVYLKSGKLSIDVQSIEACMDGKGPTPTAPPLVQPDVPDAKYPTPSPVPSPQAMYYFEDLPQSEYIIIDLSQLASYKTFTGETELSIDGRKGSIHTEFHPWNLINYPSGWGSSDVFDQANLWQCWFADFSPYCHPVADKRQPGLGVSLQKANDIDSGVKITYNGAFGAIFEIDIACDQTATKRFDITNMVINYSHTGNTHKWLVNTSLELACSNKFQPANTPYPTQTPEPSGETPSTYFSTSVNGQNIELNLNKFKYIEAYVASGYSGKYSRNQVLFSPTSKIGCPQGKTCPSYQEGNAWLCVNDSSYCYPIGNMDYGLTMNVLSKTDPYAGVTVNYDGGLHGSEVHFNFFCDESLSDDQMVIKPIDISTPPGKVHAITVMTSQVCPYVPMTLRKATPGAYFLIALGIAFVAYFGIGTLIMYVISGGISVPFEPFWVEFFECVSTAVVFIFTCGKSRTVAAYDNI